MNAPVRKRTPRQEEILDAALTIVRESGLAGLTTKGIARRMGFSEPSIYRHFASKEALILGMMEKLEEMLLGEIRSIAASASRSPIERLQAIILHHTRLIREENSLPILLFAEASTSENPRLMQKMRSILHAYLSILEGILREGQAQGRFPEEVKAECLALLLMGAPAGLAIRHRLLPDEKLETAFEESLIPFLLKIIEPHERRDIP